jgi:hypothetical protein
MTGRHAKVGRGRLVALIVLLDMIIVAGIVVFAVLATDTVLAVV